MTREKRTLSLSAIFVLSIYLFSFNLIISAEELEKIAKCCPNGEALEIHDRKTVFCTQVPSKYGNLFVINKDTKIFFPKCLEYHLQLYDFRSTTFHSNDSCLEKVYKKDLLGLTEYIVIVRCEKNDFSKDHLNKYATVVKNVQKCCPFGGAVNVQTRVCEEDKKPNQPVTITWNGESTVDLLNVYYAETIRHFTNCDYKPINKVNGSILMEYQYVSNVPNGKNALCIDSTNNDNIDFALGYCQCIDDTKCVSKCCAPDEIFEVPSCVTKSENLTFNNITDVELQKHYIDTTGAKDYMHHCSYALYKLSRKHLWDAKEGTTTISTTNTYTHADSCYDLVKKDNKLEYAIYICLDKPVYHRPGTLVLSILSTICLFLTLITYWYLPFLRKRHGKCTICELISYCIAFTCSTITHLDGVWNTTSGLILGYLALYFFFCTRTWFNVMSYDVWMALCEITFKQRPKIVRLESIAEDQRKIDKMNETECNEKFYRYSLFAWCFPILMIITIIICENSELIDIQYRPNITPEACWFSKYTILNGGQVLALRNYGEAMYFRIPLAVSLLISLFLLVTASIKYTRMKNIERKKFGNAYNPNYVILKTYNNQVKMNWKLFITIVIPMLAKTIQQLMEPFEEEHYWMYRIFYNMAFLWSTEGILIFIVFVLFKVSLIGKLYKIKSDIFTMKFWRNLNNRGIREQNMNYDSNEEK